MGIVFEQRHSDSPYLETITHGHTLSAGSSIRPAESHWHMVIAYHQGKAHPFIVGPWTNSGLVNWGSEAEILWIKFKLGTFMPHLPAKFYLNSETPLPEARSNSFWLKGSTWQHPTYENVETFINRLVQAEVLVSNPLVNAVLQGYTPKVPPRTLRHHFLATTGITHSQIRQTERAQYAVSLLQQGVSILDTVHQAGYFDQPHLTRSLKRFIGKTPAQILATLQPA